MKMAALMRSRIRLFAALNNKTKSKGLTLVPCAGVLRVDSCRISDSKDGFRLIAAACVERKPLISADATLLELKCGEVLGKVELERSLICDHELRHLEDERRKKRFADGRATENDLEALPQTAQDFEDLATDEFQKFSKASRMTKADELGDRRSLNRHLQRHLLLLLRSKPSAPDFTKSFGDWHLPCALHAEGETLKQTAERAFKEFCGDQLEAIIIGSSPVGFYKCFYPKKHCRDGLIGAKVFFFRGHYVKGKVVYATESIEDHCWLTREEMEDVLAPNRKYLNALKSFTYDERFTYRLKKPILKSESVGIRVSN